MSVSKRAPYTGPSRAGEMLLELLGRYTCKDERLARHLLRDANPNAGVEFPLSAQIRAGRRIVYRDLLWSILFAAFFGAIPIAGACFIPFQSPDGKSAETRGGSERSLCVVILWGKSRHSQRVVVHGAGHRAHERVLRSRPAPLHPRRQTSPAGGE